MSSPARIIKAAAPAVARRIDGVVFETDRRVRQMVAAAEADARRIVTDAEEGRSRIFAEASEAGRAEGHARAAGAVARAALERDRILREAEREVVALALAVARKILGRELVASASAVVDLAAGAVAEARARREVVLRVSPDDAAAIRGAEQRLAAALSRAPLQIVEDPGIEPGGAIVETEEGRIDARIETQLAVLARAVEEVLA